MEVNAVISTVILVAFIVTIILAVGSYLMYKARERRRPRSEFATAGGEPVFFERFLVQRPDRDRVPDGKDDAGSE